MDLNGSYSFDENALPQPPTNDLFGSELFANNAVVSNGYYSFDETALQQTVTDTSGPTSDDWLHNDSLDILPSAWYSTPLLSCSDTDAPFERDESE